MKTILRITVAVAGLATLAAPAVADGMDPAKMTCADYLAMDHDGMMKAVEAMHMASPDAAMMMDDSQKMMAGDATAKACEGHPDMRAMDAMMMKQ